jgi:hypothetical protein
MVLYNDESSPSRRNILRAEVIVQVGRPDFMLRDLGPPSVPLAGNIGGKRPIIYRCIAKRKSSSDMA